MDEESNVVPINRRAARTAQTIADLRDLADLDDDDLAGLEALTGIGFEPEAALQTLYVIDRRIDRRVRAHLAVAAEQRPADPFSRFLDFAARHWLKGAIVFTY